jgi:hypothetical protein
VSTKPENQFISGVHRYLPNVYYEKMNNPYRGGTPDVWYSGALGDLWVEYKYLPKVPKRGMIVPALSELQKRWIYGRRKEGRRVHVIVGCSQGGVWFLSDEDIFEGLPVDAFNPVPREMLAHDICNYVGTTSCRTSPGYTLQSGSSPRSTASSRRQS